MRLTTLAALPSPAGARHIIKEGREAGHACFPLRKSVLTTHHHLLVLSPCEVASRMIGCITFGDIKVHLTGLSFPAWLLLHALLQVRRTTGFLPVLRCIP